jgi:hypothetical protein
MKIKLLTIAVSGLALLVAPAASAKARHQTRAAHTGAFAQTVPAAAERWEQPHMVQLRPGLWMSSWDCIQDEGQGRRTPCTIGNAGRN